VRIPQLSEDGFLLLRQGLIELSLRDLHESKFSPHVNRLIQKISETGVDFSNEEFATLREAAQTISRQWRGSRALVEKDRDATRRQLDKVRTERLSDSRSLWSRTSGPKFVPSEASVTEQRTCLKRFKQPER